MKKIFLKTLRKFTGDPTFNPYRYKKDAEHITLIGVIALLGFFVILAFISIGISYFS